MHITYYTYSTASSFTYIVVVCGKVIEETLLQVLSGRASTFGCLSLLQRLNLFFLMSDVGLQLLYYTHTLPYPSVAIVLLNITLPHIFSFFFFRAIHA